MNTPRSWLRAPCLLLVVAGALTALGQAQGRISCTPNSVQVSGQPRLAATNPIARALELSKPGTLIELAPGDYPAFAVGFERPADDNAITNGGANSRPVTVRALGRVRVLRHADGGDTIAFVQQKRHGFLIFEGLTIQASYRTAVIFYEVGPGQSHDSIHFLDCHIEGGYDHLRRTGKESKWGVYGRALKDFQWRGVRGRSTIHDIQHEHAFYLQNPAGDIRIENVDASRLGRTFLQVTSRIAQGPPGAGKITVRGCKISDVCLAAGDDFKGGCSLTFAGRHQGTVWLENNQIRTGFDAALSALTNPGEPYGTGALLVWAPEGEPVSELVLLGNRFEFAPGCGDRPLVSLQGLRGLWLGPDNSLRTSSKYPALAIEPLGEGGAFQTQDLRALRVGTPLSIEGGIEYRGQKVEQSELARILEPK